MKVFILIILSLFTLPSVLAQGQGGGGAISITCTSGLNLGSFLLSRGLSSAEDTGSSRLGIFPEENRATGQATGPENSTISIIINNNSSTLNLSNGSSSFNINPRIENSSGSNLGTSALLSLGSGLNNFSDFFINASVPAQPDVYTSSTFSATLLISVVIN